MIKQIVLQIGRRIIDFFAWFDLVIITVLLLFGVFAVCIADFEFYLKIFMVLGVLLIAVILFIISILCKYFTYLFIDIRDNTSKMANNNEETEDLNKRINVILKNLGITFIIVIVIGLFISGIAYLQRTLHNQENNFKISALNKTIKNIDKYNDTRKLKLFGFMYNPENTEQLKILEVTKNSSADKAGIKVDDVFTKVNNYDISKGFVPEKIKKEFDKDKLNVELVRGGNIKNLQIKRLPYDEKNLAIFGRTYTNTPYMYINSYDFSDKYALGYFKIYENIANNDYVKTGIVCNCNPKEKSITSIWSGNYKKGILINDENYINLKTLQEEKIYPNTHGDIMWQTVCQLHKTLSDEEKTKYRKYYKSTKQ